MTGRRLHPPSKPAGVGVGLTCGCVVRGRHPLQRCGISHLNHETTSHQIAGIYGCRYLQRDRWEYRHCHARSNMIMLSCRTFKLRARALCSCSKKLAHRLRIASSPGSSPGIKGM
jgi:hypothetical protein